jgi:hypothetical protein
LLIIKFGNNKNSGKIFQPKKGKKKMNKNKFEEELKEIEERIWTLCKRMTFERVRADELNAIRKDLVRVIELGGKEEETIEITNEDIEAIIDSSVNCWANETILHKEIEMLTVFVNDENVWKTVNYDDIRRAIIRLLTSEEVSKYIQENLRNAVSDNKIICSEIDAEIGNVILQVAFWGEIVYG